ncbi:DUF445 domain-containing protein [Candidatus Riflebacteria bacterium]
MERKGVDRKKKIIPVKKQKKETLAGPIPPRIPVILKKWLLPLLARIPCENDEKRKKIPQFQQKAWSISQLLLSLLLPLDPVFKAISFTFLALLCVDAIFIFFIYFSIVESSLFGGFQVFLYKYLAPIALGYGTNWLAIKMLFHPRQHNPIWHGLIPARREELVDAIATGISERLFSPGILEDFMQKTGLARKISTKFMKELQKLSMKREFEKDVEVLLLDVLKKSLDDPEVIQELASEGEGEFRKTIQSTLLFPIPILPNPLFQLVLKKTLIKNLQPHSPFLDKIVKCVVLHLQDRLSVTMESEDELAFLLSQSLSQTLRSIKTNTIIKSQLAQMNEAELEELLTGNVVAELQFIQVIGGVFGCCLVLAAEFVLFKASLPIIMVIATFFIYKSSCKKNPKLYKG